MTVAELRDKAMQRYLMALVSKNDDEADRFYEEGDRYNDMADALMARVKPRELELA